MAVIQKQKQTGSMQSQRWTHAEWQSAEAPEMIRARLQRGQTCSSAPGVVAGAELAPSMGANASGDDSVSCTTASCCFLAFFLWLLVICSICNQCKNGYVFKCTAASDDGVGRHHIQNDARNCQCCPRLADDGAQSLVSQIQRRTKTSRAFVVQVPLMGNNSCCRSKAVHKHTVSALDIC